MATVKTPATFDDLYHVPDDGCSYELVNGEIVKMSPTGEMPSDIAFQIATALGLYARAMGRGRARPDGIAYTVDLPRRRSFSPDASFVWSYGVANMKFARGAPVFAAEVRSEHDYGPRADRAYADKRRDYFAAGTSVVWDVDPVAERVRSYRHDRPDFPTVFRVGEMAEAEPALPGWIVAVADLFA